MLSRSYVYLARADKISGEDDELRGHVTNACIQQDLGIIEGDFPRNLQKIREKQTSNLADFSPCMTRREMARFEVAAFMVDEPWVGDGRGKGKTWSRHVQSIQNVTVSVTITNSPGTQPGVTSRQTAPYCKPRRMNHETASISRATSVSRASRRSSVSRSQSLIKKNTSPQDLRPSDILIERFVAWKAIVKQLIAYFEVRG